LPQVGPRRNEPLR